MSLFRILITILLVGAGGAVLQTYVRPIWGTIAERRVEIATVEDAISKTQDVIRLRDELVSKYNAVSQSDIERVRSFLPAGSDVTGMLMDVDVLTKAAGVKLTSIGFQEKAGGATPVAGLETLALSINVSGSYEAFQVFLDALERNLRLMDVVDISFGGGEKDDYQFTLRVRTYYQGKTIF